MVEQRAGEASGIEGEGKMNKKTVSGIMKELLQKNRKYFIILAVLLLTETFLSLLLPQISGAYIDNLEFRGDVWLAGCALGYCSIILLRGTVSVCNTFLGEKLGWTLCDNMRAEVFQKAFCFKLVRHKQMKEGDFLERIEGDVNLLLGFFSSMIVDIITSILMIFGILIVFYVKFFFLGLIFTVVTAFILGMFFKTQNRIMDLWKKVREEETNVFDEFSQGIAAIKDILESGKKFYVKTRIAGEFGKLERRCKKAAFWGNIPSTIFFSILNVGEGIVLAAGVILLRKGEMTLGDIYLILGYVGLLNTPFFSLKYELSQIPKVLAAVERLKEWLGEEEENTGGKGTRFENKSVVFQKVSFGYDADARILEQVDFEIDSCAHITLEGRSGIGKSTILHLIAGFYAPVQGNILIGGRPISFYQKEVYNRFLYYIMQDNPIFEDTVRNNITRYHEEFSDEDIWEALEAVHLKEWIKENERGLEEILVPENVTMDKAQLLAWAGALLWKPGILLVDEFDAFIHDDAVRVIDEVIQSRLMECTVIMVTHQRRSRMKADSRYSMENGRIERIG